MRYIPHTDNTIKEMLKEIGVSSMHDLFSMIPDPLILKRDLKIPAPLSETALINHIKSLSPKSGNSEEYTSFLGAGSYDHFIPVAVGHLLSRSEFYTAYTPYQPEISQGTLQAIYEFQTLICQMTGMEVANASMYDGASALAEAVIMAARVSGKKEIFISKAVHPEYRAAVRTYCRFLDLDIKEIPYTDKGKTDLDQLQENISDQTAGVVLQNPNFFGVIEDLERAGKITHKQGGMFIGVVPEPVSLGLIKPPGGFGADIVVGEAQSFGIPMSFGGPGVGFFATREKYMRRMPGRLAGQTVDTNGNRGYVLTLSTREQHIRRERATSNICTNQALCALAATIHLSLLGKKGLRKLSLLNLSKTAYAKEKLSRVIGCRIKFSGKGFNEFVIELPLEADEVQKKLIEHKIVGGVPLRKFFPELKNCMLVCTTEKRTKEEIDRFAYALHTVLNN